MRQDIEALESTTFGGKRFTRKQLCEIQTTVERFPTLSLRELGHTICENLRWKTPKGTHRIQACLGALAEMEQAGIVRLPAKKIQQKKAQKPLLWTEKTREQPKPSDKGVASDPGGLCRHGAWAETSLARNRRHHGWKYTISSMLTRPLANPNRIAGVCLSAPTST